MSHLVREVAPDEALLDLDETKAHLRVDHAGEDALISGLIDAATDYLDGRDGVLGRALVTQTWKLVLSHPPSGRSLTLPLPVVQSVTGITYYDADNSSQTWDSSNYRLVVRSEDAAIELVSGATWPSVYDRGDALTVEYVTGYGGPASVPQTIRHAARMLVAYWYDNRAAAQEKSFDALPIGVRALLLNHRVAGALI